MHHLWSTELKFVSRPEASVIVEFLFPLDDACFGNQWVHYSDFTVDSLRPSDAYMRQ